MSPTPSWKLVGAGMAGAGLALAAVAGVGGPRTAVEPIELSNGTERVVLTDQAGAQIRPLGTDGSLAAPTPSPDSAPLAASATSERSAAESTASAPSAPSDDGGARAVEPTGALTDAESPSPDSFEPAAVDSPDSVEPAAEESPDSPSPETPESPDTPSAETPSSPSVDSA